METIHGRTKGTFKAQPLPVTPVGGELVVMHRRNTMTMDDQSIATDVVLVRRIVEGKIAEMRDIPSVYTQATDA